MSEDAREVSLVREREMPAAGRDLVPPRLSEEMRVRTASPHERLFDDAQSLEYRVFHASGFCTASLDEVVEDYRDVRNRSVFHCVIDSDERPVGVVRAIVGNWDELPVGMHSPRRWEPMYPLDPVCEYASLAIDPDFRGTGVAEALYRETYQFARRAGVEGLVALVDDWLLDLLRDVYGFCFRPVGPPGRWGAGEVLPIGASFADLEPPLASDLPNFWAFLTEGFTLDEMRRLGGPPPRA